MRTTRRGRPAAARDADEAGYGLVAMLGSLVSLGLVAGGVFLAVDAGVPSQAPKGSNGSRPVTPTSVTSAEKIALASSCNADARTVDIAVSAALAENPGVRPASPAAWREDLTSSHGLANGPYLAAWPSNAAYTIAVAGPHAAKDTGDAVSPQLGDVLVTVTASHRTYDFTIDPNDACGAL